MLNSFASGLSMYAPPVAVSQIFVTFLSSLIAEALNANIRTRKNKDSLKKVCFACGRVNEMMCRFLISHSCFRCAGSARGVSKCGERWGATQKKSGAFHPLLCSSVCGLGLPGMNEQREDGSTGVTSACKGHTDVHNDERPSLCVLFIPSEVSKFHTERTKRGYANLVCRCGRLSVVSRRPTTVQR